MSEIVLGFSGFRNGSLYATSLLFLGISLSKLVNYLSKDGHLLGVESISIRYFHDYQCGCIALILGVDILELEIRNN